MAFTVTKSGDTDLTTSVLYETSNGTAIAGEGYVPTSGLLTFSPDEYQKTVVVSGMDDNAFEGQEQFYLDLKEPSIGSATSKARGIATINDNEIQPAFEISDATATEGQELQFAVTLNSASTTSHSIHITSVGGTAENDQDYQSFEADLTFAPGETEQHIMIATMDDTSAEPATETFQLVLSDPTNGAGLSDPVGVGSIVDDEVPVKQSLPLIEQKEYPESVRYATFNLTPSLGGGDVDFVYTNSRVRNDDVTRYGTQNIHDGIKVPVTTGQATIEQPPMGYGLSLSLSTWKKSLLQVPHLQAASQAG